VFFSLYFLFSFSFLYTSRAFSFPSFSHIWCLCCRLYCFSSSSLAPSLSSNGLFILFSYSLFLRPFLLFSSSLSILIFYILNIPLRICYFYSSCSLQHYNFFFSICYFINCKFFLSSLIFVLFCSSVLLFFKFPCFILFSVRSYRLHHVHVFSLYLLLFQLVGPHYVCRLIIDISLRALSLCLLLYLLIFLIPFEI
jgi:hypothetical protein